MGDGPGSEVPVPTGEWQRSEVPENKVDRTREVKSISLKKAKEKLEGSWPHAVAYFLDRTGKWYKFERVA